MLSPYTLKTKELSPTLAWVRWVTIHFESVGFSVLFVKSSNLNFDPTKKGLVQQFKCYFNISQIPLNCWISFLNGKLALKLLTEYFKMLDLTYKMLDSTLSRCSHSPNSSKCWINSLVFRVYTHAHIALNCRGDKSLSCTGILW